MRPLGPGGGEGDILFEEGRARMYGGPVDVNQQRAKSAGGEMAMQAFAVKAVTFQTQADDLPSQARERGVAEPARL